MTFEQNPTSPENEQNIASIVKTLKSQSWYEVLKNESIGGNAGNNQAAINAFAEKKTGNIVEFGNIQDVDPAIRDNPEYGEVSFLYDYGTSFLALRKKLQPEEIISEHFVAVFSDSVSARALANLNEAVRRYNTLFEEEQRSKYK